MRKCSESVDHQDQYAGGVSTVEVDPKNKNERNPPETFPVCFTPFKNPK
jgi:hypothetical protein